MMSEEKCCYAGIAHDCHGGEGCRIAERMKASNRVLIGWDTKTDEPIFATLPQRPWIELTDEDLRKLADKHLHCQPEGYEVSGVFNFARAIEAAVREKQK